MEFVAQIRNGFFGENEHMCWISSVMPISKICFSIIQHGHDIQSPSRLEQLNQCFEFVCGMVKMLYNFTAINEIVSLREYFFIGEIKRIVKVNGVSFLLKNFRQSRLSSAAEVQSLCSSRYISKNGLQKWLCKY